jgi:hypothetical protein
MRHETRDTRAQKIARLNDAFRTTFEGGNVLLTAGVDALPEPAKASVLERVRTFADFGPDNDPHGEHDFGAFGDGGQRFFFKIDYYDQSLQFGSEDPSDPEKTTRVLTIMLADEY